MWAFYENLLAKEDLLSESPHISDPLPGVDAQSPIRPWPGFRLVSLLLLLSHEPHDQECPLLMTHLPLCSIVMIAEVNLMS